MFNRDFKLNMPQNNIPAMSHLSKLLHSQFPSLYLVETSFFQLLMPNILLYPTSDLSGNPVGSTVKYIIYPTSQLPLLPVPSSVNQIVTVTSYMSFPIPPLPLRSLIQAFRVKTYIICLTSLTWSPPIFPNLFSSHTD